MTKEQKLLDIAEYDFGGSIPEYHPIMSLFNGERVPFVMPDYLKNLNALHMVAMKVIDDLYTIFKNAGAGRYSGHTLRCAVMASCCDKPVDGEYIDLFDCVHEAVDFLKKNKPTAL